MRFARYGIAALAGAWGWWIPAPAADAARPALVELDGTASTDPEGDPLTYAWTQVSGPRVELSDPTSAKPYFRTAVAGAYVFELVVADSRRKSRPVRIEVLVEKENLPPSAVVPGEVEIELGQEVVLDGSASRDPDGQELRFHWEQISGPPLGLAEDVRLQPVLALDAIRAGIYEFDLTVSDGKALSRPARCRLTVRPPNEAPVARVTAAPRISLERPAPAAMPAAASAAPALPAGRVTGPDFAVPGETVTLDGRAGAAPGAQYFWKQKSGPFVRVFERPEEGLLRFSPSETGRYEFELVVADARGESAPVVHTLRIETGNEPPIAVAEAPALGRTGERVRLDGTKSYDREGAGIEYRWRQIDGPRVTSFALLDEGGAGAPSFVPDEPGEYRFELIVTDGRKESRPSQVRVRVERGNSLPVARTAGSLTIRAGESALLQGAGEDPDGDPVVLLWRQTSGPALLKGEARQTALTLAPETPGDYGFELVADDGKSRSRPVPLRLRVEPKDAAATEGRQPLALSADGPELDAAGEPALRERSLRIWQKPIRQVGRPASTPPDLHTAAPRR